MDEIDQVVDNLFSQYIKPGSEVTGGNLQAAVSKAEQPPAPPSVDQSPDDLIMEVSPSPDVGVQEVTTAHPDIKVSSAVTRSPAKKKAARSVPKKKIRSSKGIKEIKMETAKMLRYLSSAIKSDNWWHKLYYSHKFVRKSMYIAQVITKRPK